MAIYLLLETVVICTIFVFDVFAQPGYRNICPSEQQPQCLTEWSDWTTCLPPELPIEQGVISFRGEIEDMKCEVPIWFWQATLESKMMRFRKQLNAYRQANGMGPRKVIIKKRIKPKKKSDEDEKSEDDDDNDDGDSNETDDGKGSKGDDDNDSKDKGDKDKDDDKNTFEECFDDKKKMMDFMKQKKGRAAMIFWCKQQATSNSDVMSDKLKDMLKKMKEENVDDYYHYMMGGKGEEKPKNKKYDPVVNNTIRKVFWDEQGSQQSWVEKLLQMDETERQVIEDLLWQWRDKVLESMEVYQQLTEAVILNGAAQSTSPSPELRAKFAKIELLNHEASQLLKQAEEKGLTNALELMKTVKSPCNEDSDSVNQQSDDAGQTISNPQNTSSVLNPNDPAMCSKLEEFLQHEQKLMKRCPLKINADCKRLVQPTESMKRQAKELIPQCRNDMKGKYDDSYADLFELMNLFDTKEGGGEGDKNKYDEERNRTAPPVTKELRETLKAYNKATLRGLELSLEVAIITRINASMYREMMTGDNPDEPPAWLQYKLDKVDEQMMSVSQHADILNRFVENGGTVFDVDICTLFNGGGRGNGGGGGMTPACYDLRIMAYELQEMKSQGGMFPPNVPKTKRSKFMKFKEAAPQLLFHCKNELLSGKVMPMKFYKMLQNFEKQIGACQCSKGEEKSKEKNLYKIVPDGFPLPEEGGNTRTIIPEIRQTTAEETELLKTLLQEWKVETVGLLGMAIDFSSKLITDPEARKEVDAASLETPPEWIAAHFKKVEERKKIAQQKFAEIVRIQPWATEQLEMINPCGGYPSKGGNVAAASSKDEEWLLSVVDKKQPKKKPETNSKPAKPKPDTVAENENCNSLMEFFELNEMNKQHKEKCKAKPPKKEPAKKRTKRQMIEEDADEFEFTERELNSPPSAGCGFCARRIRCCKDKYFSWIDQQLESEVCEEYSTACEVPPMAGGDCDYGAAMPKLVDDEMTYNRNPKNKQLAQRLRERVEDKWLQSLGSTEPAMHCTKRDGLCYCCCGNHTAQLNQMGYMTCRKFKGTSSTGPSSTTLYPEPEPSRSTTPGSEPEPSNSATPSAEPSRTTTPTPEPEPKTAPLPSICQSSTGLLPKGCSGEDCQYKLDWKAPSEGRAVLFIITFKLKLAATPGMYYWTGVGFSEDKEMGDDDVIIVKVKDNVVQGVEDRQNLPGYQVVLDTGEQNVELVTWSVESNGWMRVEVRKQCSDTDTADKNLCNSAFIWLLPYSGGPMGGEAPGGNPQMHRSNPEVTQQPISLDQCFT